MLAEQLIREGNLAAALKALQDLVRKDPSSAKHRVFLFQLLSVMGNWPRALTQLNVAAELDASTLPMAQTYREALQCEALRAEIFSGKRAPLIFGEPEPWLAMMLEAVRYSAQGKHDKAASIREQALELAPSHGGTINGERFEWIADADQRLGPILEVIVNGRYYWIPFQRIQQVQIEAPSDLRDTVWTAATFIWANGGETVGLIPTRYNDTAASTDSALLLARRTEWVESGAHTTHGMGQRMFATDIADYALMDARLIEFDPIEQAAGETAVHAGEDKDETVDSTDSMHHG